MEGALPSVVGGLVARPVIAVPTSVGYGASLGGLAALLAMLNSCAANVTVVNIDNGFGAGFVAALIARQSHAARGAREKAQAMSVLVLEPVGGIAGDMLIAALLHSAPAAALDEGLRAWRCRGVSWRARGGGRRIRALALPRSRAPDDRHAHRPWREIRDLLSAPGFPARPRELAQVAFALLAEAEGRHPRRRRPRRSSSTRSAPPTPSSTSSAPRCSSTRSRPTASSPCRRPPGRDGCFARTA